MRPQLINRSRKSRMCHLPTVARCCSRLWLLRKRWQQQRFGNATFYQSRQHLAACFIPAHQLCGSAFVIPGEQPSPESACA